MSYARFLAMIATSTLVMFALMYLNTYAWPHVAFSETRAYMAVLMGATMAIVMLSFMMSMYASKAVNAAILVGAAAVFAGSLWLVRSQATVDGVSYMRAMIPHHSIAILTSERANISDPRVRKLADEIIAAQRKEISEMQHLIADLTGEATPERPDATEPAPAQIGSAAEALAAPVLATLDAATLTRNEIDRALTGGRECRFLRSENSDPILVTRMTGAGPARGVMKLSGQLVALDQGAIAPAADTGATMVSDDVSMRVRPLARDDASDTGTAADLVFELEQGVNVGYRGIWSCAV